MDIKGIILSKDANANIHFIDRYINIINLIKPSDHNEKHHILPKSIFPDHTKISENIILVPAKWHYLLHWILMKIFVHELYQMKMIFAFNNMKRIIPSNKNKGILYELGRKYVSACISKSNTGNSMSEQNKNDMSVRCLGTLIVKDKAGKKFRVRKDNKKYLSGEYVFYRVGTKHTQDTKTKMSNNGIKNRVACYDINNVRYYFDKDNIPEGYTIGTSDDFLRKLSNGKKGLKFYNNGIETRRYKNIADVPVGFKPGRLKSGNFCGFSKINTRRLDE
jgi:hypothetical protein